MNNAKKARNDATNCLVGFSRALQTDELSDEYGTVVKGTWNSRTIFSDPYPFMLEIGITRSALSRGADDLMG